MFEKLLKSLTMILLSVLCLAIVSVMFSPALSALSFIGNIFFDIIKENTEEAENYVKGKNKITNALGESYTVKNEERCGFPDHRLDIEISANRTLLKYSLDYGGNLKDVPNELLRLFREGTTEYYFAGAEGYDFIFAFNAAERHGKRLDFDERDNLTGEQAERIHNQNLEAPP